VVLCNAPLRSFVGLLWVLCGPLRSFVGPLRSFAVFSHTLHMYYCVTVVIVEWSVDGIVGQM